MNNLKSHYRILLGLDDSWMNQRFQGELHFDRPIVALILQKDLLDSSDAQLALPETDFRNIFRRGINDGDQRTIIQYVISYLSSVIYY